MSTATTTTVVGVFSDRSQADQAIDALRAAGFRETQIGVMTRSTESYAAERAKDIDTEEKTETGVLTGAMAGAGVGGLIGLGVISGMIPVIGPALAAGTLGVILSNAAAGAAVAGLAGALIGWGVPEEDARYYESEFSAGKTVVTVAPDGREAEARSLLRRFGGTSRGEL
jgi:hypothetical protein